MDNDIKLHGKIEFLIPSSRGGEHLIALDFETGAELKGIIQHAQKEGWRPRFFGPSAANGSPSTTSTNGSAPTPPICPVHKKPMKPSTQGEGWFCPRKTLGEFCKVRSPDGMTFTQVA